jgi:hypothetical protein
MNETPEEKIMNEVETPEKNKRWTDDVVIPVPLTKFMKMKTKIAKLENKVKEADSKKYEYMRQAMDAEDKFKKIKADYEKLLGIDKEGEKD